MGYNNVIGFYRFYVFLFYFGDNELFKSRRNAVKFENDVKSVNGS